jgi:hypothetical protein
MRVLFRLEVLLLLEMVFIGAVVEEYELVLEVEGKLFFRDFLELINYCSEDHEFVVIGLVIVVVVVINVQEEHVLIATRGHGDTIKLRERNSPFDFVLVFDFYKLLDENFEKVRVFENVKDSFISHEEDSLFAFAMAIIF